MYAFISYMYILIIYVYTSKNYVYMYICDLALLISILSDFHAVWNHLGPTLFIYSITKIFLLLPLVVWIYHNWFVHSSLMAIWAGSSIFVCLLVMKSIAVNILVCVSWVYALRRHGRFIRTVVIASKSSSWSSFSPVIDFSWTKIIFNLTSKVLPLVLFQHSWPCWSLDQYPSPSCFPQ